MEPPQELPEPPEPEVDAPKPKRTLSRAGRIGTFFGTALVLNFLLLVATTSFWGRFGGPAFWIGQFAVTLIATGLLFVPTERAQKLTPLFWIVWLVVLYYIGDSLYVTAGRAQLLKVALSYGGGKLPESCQILSLKRDQDSSPVVCTADVKSVASWYQSRLPKSFNHTSARSEQFVNQDAPGEVVSVVPEDGHTSIYFGSERR